MLSVRYIKENNTYRMRKYRMRRKGRFFGFVFFGFFMGSLLVMLLWNALMPDLFGLTAINLFQAAGLLLLCRILFGGFPRGRGGWRRGRWRAKMRRKWAAMSPEDRDAWREKMKGWNCGPWRDREEKEEEKDDLV